MHIKQITPDIFEKFADEHPYHNFHQTLNYALLNVEEGYEYEFIGLYDQDELKAACLVLGKKINGKPYGYIPDSFLIDYEDKELLRAFTEELYHYYRKQKFVFIKINPRVVVGTVNKKTGKVTPTKMNFLTDYLQELGYTKLKDNMYFESRLPRFNAILDLSTFGDYSVSKNTRNKAKKAYRKGVIINNSGYNDVSYLTELLSKKLNNIKYHYADYYSIFEKNDMIDYFTAEIDYYTYLKKAQEYYDQELSKNRTLNNKVIKVPSNRNINKKMNSDKALEAYHSDIIKANDLINEHSGYIAACMVVKYKETITLLINDFDRKYKDFCANYLLFHAIINHYKNDYKYFDFNGIVGDFNENPYSGLNRFKIGFNPELVQYVGEYDLIINRLEYEILNKKGYLADEFNK